MKPFLIYSILLNLSLSSLAQNQFKQGYFIDTDNTRTECLIRDYDWDRTPESFRYKLSETGDLQTGNASNVKEFSVENMKFVGADVDIDISPTKLDELSVFKAPDWQKKLTFLQVLVQGKASLYVYKRDIDKFFFSVDSGQIKQLVWKKYLVTTTDVATNNSFRQQILVELSCTQKDQTPEHLSYEEKDLIKYFQNYNRCQDPNYVETKYTVTREREVFNAAVYGGVNSTSLNTYTFPAHDVPGDLYTDKFGARQSFSIGLDAEFILPYRNNKWGLTSDLNFQSYASQKDTEAKSSTISLKYLSFGLGLRHYIFLSKASKIHLGGTFNLANYVASGEYAAGYKFYGPELRNAALQKFSYRPSLTILSLGFTQNRLGLEARYTRYKNVLRARELLTTKMAGTSLLLKYALIKSKKN